MIYRKRIVWAGIALLLLICSCRSERLPANPGAPSNTADHTLNFRITWTEYSGRGEAIQKIVDNYNTQPESDCNVSMLGGNEDIGAIQKLLENDPKTIVVLPYRYVQYFGQAGLLTDLTDLFKDADTLFYPQVW
jgi:multiple sugar transport system substrate-binding protein